MKQTFGDYRVGRDFNPSANSLVDQIKAAGAAFIDLIDAIPVPERPEGDDTGVIHAMWANEVRRLKAMATTEAERATMDAVKAATKPAPRGEL